MFTAAVHVLFCGMKPGPAFTKLYALRYRDLPALQVQLRMFIGMLMIDPAHLSYSDCL